MRHVRRKAVSSFQVILAGLLISVFPGHALPQTPFYQGKTITIIQGREPGGQGDLRVKTFMPFLRKYIPGQPTIISEFIPGGGGRKAANHIYRTVRPDGLTLGNVGGGLVSNAVLGETGVQYDLEKLIHLGSPNSVTQYVFMTRKDLGLDSLEKLRARPGLRMAGQTLGHDIYVTARFFAWILGLKDPIFIAGYSGPEIDLALLRKEVDARSQGPGALLQRNPEWVEKKDVVDFHAIIEIPKGRKHPVFAHLPELESFVKSDKERKILMLFRSMRLGGSPYILPPGTPRDRVEVLQAGFKKAFVDPDFLKEYKKVAAEDASPLMPEDMERTIRELPRDSEIVEAFKKIAGGDPLPTR